MPAIYLSPSTQEYNPFIIGGSEEQHMNDIVDAMIPYLQRYGIEFSRNTPDMTAASSIAASNAGNYDFHLAIHSNASAPANAGQNRGPIFYYHPASSQGQRMAEIMRQNFTGIYPLPELVRTMPITTLGEVTRTRAPSVLAEVAFHDNWADANWIVNNTQAIAMALANSLAQYFGIPVADGSIPSIPTTPPTPSVPEPGTIGVVTLTSGYLNVRNGPSLSNPVIGMVPNGATVEIISSVGDWYQINYNNINGYVFGQYIRII